MSTMTHPSLEPLHLGGGHAEGRQHDDILRRRGRRVPTSGVAEELDALAAQPIVDVRVVDDFAGQKNAPIGKALARLIGVVDRAVDAVAEPELAREMDREPPGLMHGSRRS